MSLSLPSNPFLTNSATYHKLCRWTILFRFGKVPPFPTICSTVWRQCGCEAAATRHFCGGCPDNFQKLLLPSDSKITEKEIENKKREGMLEFGMNWFYRFNGFEATRAYLRTHIFSTMILNLDKLVEVDYERDAYVWEDI